MKQIKLTQNQITLVDDEDYERASQHKWHASFNPDTNSYYAGRTDHVKNKTVYLHNFIMDSLGVDHKDHDTLNNQKSNLRKVTRSQNSMNTRKRSGTSSKYKGVYWNKITQKWQVQIVILGKNTYLGSFLSEIEAAETYNKKAEEHFGEFALLNKVA